MKKTLSYVLFTPYTVAKSRTGGALARLLLRLDLELVGAQMIAPDEGFTAGYAKLMEEQNTPVNSKAARLLSEYVKNNMGPSGGRRHRTLMLLFWGEDPCRKLSDVCGALFAENRSIESINGETLRDTYADLILDPDDPDQVEYFEPAVLTPRTQEASDDNLRFFASWLPGQKSIVENMQYPNPHKVEQTLVIIKPDNWKHASAKPGTIIDLFSRAGVRIVGIKIHRMSVAEALEFYAPLRSALNSKFAEDIGAKAKTFLENQFKVGLSDAAGKDLTESFGSGYAEDQFQQVIEFMSGTREENCPVDEMHKPGTVKCMVLVYEGEDAQRKLRDVLGPTDPMKAPGGTVRRDFGSSIMKNTAHASSSVENAAREMKIVKVEQNTCVEIINAALADH